MEVTKVVPLYVCIPSEFNLTALLPAVIHPFEPTLHCIVPLELYVFNPSESILTYPPPDTTLLLDASISPYNCDVEP